MTKTNTLTVTHGSLTMQCRLFQCHGGYRSGTWVLSGYVNNEEHMSCDITATVRRYNGKPERLRAELEETARLRLRRIATE